MHSEEPPTPLAWKQLRTVAKDAEASHSPTPRSGHSMTVAGVTAYLFGGINADEAVEGSADMYALQISSAAMEWERLQPEAPAPPGRWKHSAVLHKYTQLIVFGGFHTSSHRLNDVWVFDSVTLKWSQPNAAHNAAAMDVSLAASGWENAPAPRAAHTATMVGEKMWVFGGYGGVGYSRRDLDDLHSLDVSTWTWQRVIAKGTAPEKRSGHQACAVEDKLYIFGGYSSVTQFDDVYFLDLSQEPPVWNVVASSLYSPLWSHAACSVVAIPTWKIFVFGGVSGSISDKERLGTASSRVVVLDTSTHQWTDPDVVGTAPSARSDTCLAYDSKNSQILLFGGWCDGWFSDLFSLDVSTVVGPPYAIMDIQPNMGPVTGGTSVKIVGIDFLNTTSVVVRFASRKAYVDVPGEFVSQAELVATTPDFSKFGSGDVEVRVALNGDSFTTTFQHFCFFSVTHASKCVMFGPGLINGGLTNQDTAFIIQARDATGQNRTAGGDEFSVVVTYLPDDPEAEEEEAVHDVSITDQMDGTYVVSYKVPREAVYEIQVTFLGTFGGAAGQLRGSGVRVRFSNSGERDSNSMSGALVLKSMIEDTDQLNQLTDDILSRLLAKTKDESWNASQSIAALVGVKEALNDVEAKTQDVDLLLDRCSAVLSYLRAQGQDVAQLEERLESATSGWDRILRETPQVQTRIAPLMRQHAAKIRADIAAYEAQLSQYRQSLAEAPFKMFDAGPETARQHLAFARTAHVREHERYEKIAHIAHIFDCARDMTGAQEIISEIEDQLQDFGLLWDVVEEAVQLIEQVKERTWESLNAELLEEDGKTLLTALRRLPKSVRSSDAYKGFDRVVKQFLCACPILASLRSPAMRARHWRELMGVVGKEIPLPDEHPEMELRQLLELGLHDIQERVEEIMEKAAREARHEETISTIQATWQGVQFVMSWYKETNVPLIRLEEADSEQLESDQLALQAILNSRFQFFQNQAHELYAALKTIGAVLQLIEQIQKMWSYLEPLFIGGDEVKRELPKDAEVFQQVNTQLKSTLQKCWKIRNVKSACLQDGLLEQLETMQAAQEQCKKSLSEYLDGKRRQFPRFYFISEVELLDILSNSSNPSTVLQHVHKILTSTGSVKLAADKSSGALSATSFTSAGTSEEVSFGHSVALNGRAEAYLTDLIAAQGATLQTALVNSLKRMPTQSRTEWVFHQSSTGQKADPAQIMLLAANIEFAARTEKALSAARKGNSSALQSSHEQQLHQLQQLTKLVLTKMRSSDRVRTTAMITHEAHYKDVIESLRSVTIEENNTFAWKQHFRASFPDQRNQVQCQIGDTSIPYAFEYVGSSYRLAITPLSDRVFLAMALAVRFRLGAALVGPAATGKTEHVKELAALTGKTCYVFNCSPELGLQASGNILKGIAASGAWASLDHLDRFSGVMLAAFAVQLKSVCDAWKGYSATNFSKQKLVFEGQDILLNPGFALFATLTPGYLKRTPTPSSLETLLRPIALIQPDTIVIVRHRLTAGGFVAADEFAHKIMAFYEALQHTASPCQHYSWRLRDVYQFIQSCCRLRLSQPEAAEEDLVLRAVREHFAAKLAMADEFGFLNLLSDFFPAAKEISASTSPLEGCVINACDQECVWPEELFVQKVLQLHTVLSQLPSVLLVGEAGAGKSTCWKTLRVALEIRRAQDKAQVVNLNPRVLSAHQLYGYSDPETQEWKDGLFSALLRQLVKVDDGVPKWVVMDGLLEPSWLDSLHTVMDDSRVLTLASGERISLPSEVKLLFEATDLRFATPSAVSRAGLVFMPTDAGTQWRSLLASWVQSRPAAVWQDESRSKLHQLFEKYVPDTLKCFQTTLQGVVPYNDVSLITSVLRTIDVFIDPQNIDDDVTFESAFVFCFVWAVGGVLGVCSDGTDSKKVFSEWWRSKFRTIKLPARETVFDYWLDVSTGRFESWKACPSYQEVPYSPTAEALYIPTTETVSVSFWMESLMPRMTPIMLLGASGSGKTSLVRALLANLDKDHFSTHAIRANYFTTAQVLQKRLEQPLAKRTGNVYGPQNAARLVYFIDDVHEMQVDEYGTHPALELLRQYADYSQWYDAEKATAKQIQDTQMVASFSFDTGSNHIDLRTQRHFTTLVLSALASTSLLTIYQTLFEGHLHSNAFTTPVAAIATHLIKASLALHKEVSNTFKRSSVNFHYEFTTRHLDALFQGLRWSTPGVFTNPEKFVHLWLHEAERVYCDRLSTQDDQAKFTNMLVNQAKKAFPQFNLSKLYGPSANGPPLFCHYTDALDPQQPIYDHVTELKTLKTLLEKALVEYNAQSSPMDLVLFDDAIAHVTRITRVLRRPGGHALLVGATGAGKRSLTKFSAALCGYNLHELRQRHSQGVSADHRSQLQEITSQAGVSQEGTVLLVAEDQMTSMKLLSFMNELLGGGSLAELYNKDELDLIVNQLNGRAKMAGFNTDPASVWEYFVSQVRSNLHLCFSFSSSTSTLRECALKFPAIISCTTMDYFRPWPIQAYQAVAKHWLEDDDIGEAALKITVENFFSGGFAAVERLCAAQDAERKLGMQFTPVTYVGALRLFSHLLKTKRALIDQGVVKLRNCVERVKESSDDVVTMEANLKALAAQAKDKIEIAEELSKRVASEKEALSQQQARVTQQIQRVASIEQDIAARSQDVELHMAGAEPAIARAMAAIDGMDRRELGSCKTIAKLPPGIEDVFGAVMVLFAGINPSITVLKNGRVRDKDRSWEVVKRVLLTNVNALTEDLRGFKQLIDQGSVPEINWREIRPFLALEHFNPDLLEKRNNIAACLCVWVINMVQYYDILLVVEPKRQGLELVTKQLAEATKELAELQARVGALQASLTSLQSSLEEAEVAKQEAQKAVDKGKFRIENAHRLSEALRSERERWMAEIDGMEADKAFTLGNCLLATWFVSFFGPFTQKYRDELLQQHLVPLLLEPELGIPIPIPPNVDPLYFLTTDPEIAQWKVNGLSSDRRSAENAAIVMNTRSTPLLIDPYHRALAWISKQEKSATVIPIASSDLMRTLRHSLVQGSCVIITGVGQSVNPELLPLIQQAYIERGHGQQQFVMLEGEEVPVHSKFRLILQTSSSKPNLSDSVHAAATVVDFSLAEHGLVEQVLKIVVSHEWPTVGQQLLETTIKRDQAIATLQQLEDSIVSLLSATDGEIVDDGDMIRRLEETKEASTTLAAEFEEVQTSFRQLDLVVAKYQPVAQRAILLYQMLESVTQLHPFYVLSLESFCNVVVHAVEKLNTEVPNTMSQQLSARPADPDDANQDSDPLQEVVFQDVSDRCERLIVLLTQQFHSEVSIGLFELDRRIFSLFLTLRVLTEEQQIPPAFTDILLRPAVADETSGLSEELNEWLSEEKWGQLRSLEADFAKVDSTFEGISEKIAVDAEEWEEWYSHYDAENHGMPGDYGQLPELYRMLLIRILRPDRLWPSLGRVLSQTLHVTPVPEDELCTDCVTPTLPGLYLCGKHVDVCQELLDASRSHGPSPAGKPIDLVILSMRPGLEGAAEAHLESLSRAGGWLLLHNADMVPSWLTNFCWKYDSLVQHSHPSFKCFLAVDCSGALDVNRNGPASTPSIPEDVLRRCVRISVTRSSDLKRDLKRSWSRLSQTTVDACSRPAELKAFLFGLCVYHSVLNGRSKFSPTAFMSDASFNAQDVDISIQIALEALNDGSAAEFPTDVLCGVVGEAVHGGRLSNMFDERVNHAYLETMLCNDVFRHDTAAVAGIQMPSPSTPLGDYDRYIDEAVPLETPAMYGLASNASMEISSICCNRVCEAVAQFVAEDRPVSAARYDAYELAKSAADDMLRKLPEPFNMTNLAKSSEEVVSSTHGPYVLVALQECTRMNEVLVALKRALEELRRGLLGQVSLTAEMEAMAQAFNNNALPESASCMWARHSWLPRASLKGWFASLLQRHSQLQHWIDKFETPHCLWLGGLMNPRAMLVAMKQVASRATNVAASSFAITAHITTFTRPEQCKEFNAPQHNGLLITGLHLQGSKWSAVEESAENFYSQDGLQCGGHLMECGMNTELPAMPIVYILAAPDSQPPVPSSFDCPVFKDPTRSEYILSVPLATTQPAQRWVLAGTALLLGLDE